MADEAARYFELARQCLRARRGGVLITCGVSGSGKTTVAHVAAQAQNGVMVRSDAIRKHLAGLPLQQRGEAALYSTEMTVRTYTTLIEQARAIVQSGRWVIIDAVHARRAEREAAATLARELQVPFGILYCDAPREVLEQRLVQRGAEKNEVSDADTAVLEKQLVFFEPLVAGEGPVCTCPGGELPQDWRKTLALP